MALTGNSRLGSVPVRHYARGAQVYAVSFTADNPPVLLHQDEAVVSSVSRTGAGVYVLALQPRFKRVYPMGSPNVRKAGDYKANVKALAEGTSDATVTIEVVNGAAAADPAATVDLVLWLVDSGGS